jgi:hypothetical protein
MVVLFHQLAEHLLLEWPVGETDVITAERLQTRLKFSYFRLKRTRQLTKAVQLGIDERLPVLLPLTPAARAPEPPVTRKNKKLEQEKNSTYIRKELHIINY